MNSAAYTNFQYLSKSKINKFLQQNGWSLGTVIRDAKEKNPNDWVTIFDLQISQIIQDVINELQLPHQLLSEENWKNGTQIDFNSPLIILDPIDGTNGFMKGTKYFSLSLSIMENSQFVYSWIWNFGTQEEVYTQGVRPNTNQTNPNLGLVSQSEWNKGLWAETLPVISKTPYQLKSCGSIAYKLLLLCNDQCHFIASKEPKNIWDISAGTHLAWEKGYKFYCKNQEVVQFKQIRWEAPMLWCLPEEATVLHKLLFG